MLDSVFCNVYTLHVSYPYYCMVLKLGLLHEPIGKDWTPFICGVSDESYTSAGMNLSPVTGMETCLWSATHHLDSPDLPWHTRVSQRPRPCSWRRIDRSGGRSQRQEASAERYTSWWWWWCNVTIDALELKKWLGMTPVFVFLNNCIF